ncbi:MAG: DUF4440 domain-containing protein [Porticoccaceae bacterium]|jgi:hypothetical protein|nr:DUF4440 domain-containing protein [Porticoccaceae bacterium]
MRDEALPRFANDAFYRAFRDRDQAAMARLWSLRQPLLCAHPGARPLYERAAVLESWANILGSPNCPRLEYRIERVLHCGELVLITCYEWSRAQPDGMLLATNGFMLEAGEYRMTIHQAGPVRALVLSGDTGGGERVH